MLQNNDSKFIFWPKPVAANPANLSSHHFLVVQPSSRVPVFCSEPTQLQLQPTSHGATRHCSACSARSSTTLLISPWATVPVLPPLPTLVMCHYLQLSDSLQQPLECLDLPCQCLRVVRRMTLLCSSLHSTVHREAAFTSASNINIWC